MSQGKISLRKLSGRNYSYDPRVERDPFFTNVSLLLHGDGNNGTNNSVILDSGPNNFTITNVGNPSQGSFSPFTIKSQTAYSKIDNGGSIYFGGSDYLTLATSTSFGYGAGDFTWEMWVCPTNISNATNNYILDHGSNGGAIQWVSNKIQVVITGLSAISTNSTGLLVNGNWYHIAVVRASSVLSIYVNGVSQTLNSSAASVTMPSTNTLTVANYGGTGYGWPGYISNLRITKSAVYTSNFTPSNTPLDNLTTDVFGPSVISQLNGEGTNGSTTITDAFIGNTHTAVGGAELTSANYKYGTSSINLMTGAVALGGAFTTNLKPFTESTLTLESWIYPTSFSDNSNIFSNYKEIVERGMWKFYMSASTGDLRFLWSRSALTGRIFDDMSSNNIELSTLGDIRNDLFSPFDGQFYGGRFNGTDGYISAPANTNWIFAGDLTIEAWVYPTGASAVDQHIFGTGGSGSNDQFIFAPGAGNGRIAFAYAEVGNAYLNSALTIPQHQWAHVAVSRTGTTLKAFVNGTEVYSGTVSASIGQNLTTYVGARQGTTNFINGGVSNLRVVNGTGLYTANFTPSTSPLTAVTNTVLLTLQSSRFKDNSSNNYVISTGASPEVVKKTPFTYTPLGASAYFNGSTDYITASAAAPVGTNQFTIEAWVYKTTSALETICSYGGSAGNLRLFMDNATTISLWNGTTQQNVATVPSVLNAWHHVVLQRNASNLVTIYFDGMSVSTATRTDNYSTGSLAIGAEPGGGSKFTGNMSNFRYVTGSALYTSNFTPSTSPLTSVTGTSLLTLRNSVPSNNEGFLDSSVNNIKLAQTGTPTQGSFSPFSQNGWSGYFDGSSRVTIPTNAAFTLGTQDHTIEFWMYQSSQQTYSTPWGYSSPFTTYAASAYYLYVGSTASGLALGNGAGAWAINDFFNTPTLNIWHHYALTRQGSTFRVFVDGTLVLTSTYSGSIDAQSAAMAIGGVQSANSNCIGNLSNFRMVVGTAIYTSNFTPSTSPLTSVTGTTLLTLQNNRFKDNSTSNFTISVVGSPSIQPTSPFKLESWSETVNGGAMYFNGSTDFLSTTSINPVFSFGTGDFCVEAWVFPLASVQAAIISNNYNWSTGLGNWGFYTSFGAANTLYFNSTSGNRASSSTVLIPLNQWSHIAYTRQGTAGRFFVNGVKIGNDITDSTTYASTTGTLYVADKLAASGKFNGYISGLNITKGAATYTATFTPPTSPASPNSNTSLLLNGSNIGVFDVMGKNVITAVGSATTKSAVAKYGGALSLSTAGDYFKFPASANAIFGSGNFTVEMWVYKSSGGQAATNTLFNLADGLATFTGLYIYVTSGGTVGMYISSNGSSWDIASAQTIGTFTNNIWYHLAIVRNGTTIKAYIDGVQGASVTIGATTAISSAGNTITLGGNNASTTFYGYIDDLRITKGIARYSANFSAPTQAHPNKSNDDAYFQYNSLLLQGDVISPTTIVTSSISPTLNTWNHVALVVDSSTPNDTTLRFFVNGEMETFSGYDMSPQTVQYNSPRIGTDGDGNDGLIGYVDDARITSDVRYVTNFTPATAALNSVLIPSQLLLSGTNAAIIDNTTKNNLIIAGDTRTMVAVNKFGGSSIYFDGTGDSIKALSSTALYAFGTGDYTIEFWMYPTAIPNATNMLIDTRTGTGDGVYLAINNSSVLVTVINSSASVNGAISLNIWQHIAHVRYGSTWKTFINGTQVATGSDSTNITDNNCQIGVSLGDINYFTGYIDDMRITKGVARYDASFNPSTIPHHNY